MTGNGEFVELQGSGEEATFSKPQLTEMINLAESGINNLLTAQRMALNTKI
jgi:ribonuclease PH